MKVYKNINDLIGEQVGFINQTHLDSNKKYTSVFHSTKQFHMVKEKMESDPNVIITLSYIKCDIENYGNESHDIIMRNIGCTPDGTRVGPKLESRFLEGREIIVSQDDLYDEYKKIPFDEISFFMFPKVMDIELRINDSIKYHHFTNNNDIPYIEKLLKHKGKKNKLFNDKFYTKLKFSEKMKLKRKIKKVYDNMK